MNQIFVNSLISASVYILIGLSFSLIYQTNRFFHFPHAAIFTLGPYAFLFSQTIFHFSPTLSIIFAIVLSSMVGYGIYYIIYLPLQKIGASSLILLLASLGVYIILQNIISIFWGDDTKSIRTGEVSIGFNILGARITQAQILIITACAAIIIIYVILFKLSSMSKIYRAVAENPMLANITGIKSGLVISYCFIIGSSIVGVSGILYAFDLDMVPIMGLYALMMGIISVLIGGIGSVSGIILGAILLSVSQQLGGWYLGSQWQEAIAFIILALFLLIRPQGFFGKELNKAKI